MKLTGEQLSAVRAAKSPEELIAIADKMGVTVSENDAALYYNRLHTSPELAEDELAAIAGGAQFVPCGYEPKSPPKEPCIRGFSETKAKPECAGCEHYQMGYSMNGGRMEGAMHCFRNGSFKD
jgi:hypothetical protein